MFRFLRDKLRGVSKKLEDELDKELGEKLEKELAEKVAAPPPVPTLPAAPKAAALQPPPAPPPRTAAPQPVASPAAAPLPATVPVAVPPAAKPTPPKPPVPPPPAKPVGRKLLSEQEIEARLAAELSQAVAAQKQVEAAAQVASGGRFTLNEEVLEGILWDLEVGLLESDVALPVIEAIKGNVKEQLLSLPLGGRRPEELVEKVLRTAIEGVLTVRPLDFDAFVRERLAAGKRPVVVMFVGVNGTGKTTSIARIAHRLKNQGISAVLAAGDTFRAGAIEQLALHGERLGVTVVKHKAGADPAAVAYDAVEHAKARRKDVVLLDTAGRMQNNQNLMDEMDKVRRVANPDLTIFVGDSLAGNDAVEQARRFDEIVDVGGVILTKVDVDAKGGAALSVAYTIRKPLLFVGVGQGYDDLKPFDAKWLVDRLFGDEAEAEA
ncbi:MAG TPA: signal recognition particle-docking protein FtsY [Candidatus Thermoplasmatota archaeon]|nr:signal recognition particle-docking protein FtsY [Candidatus Thermoplasmatota archaeon]